LPNYTCRPTTARFATGRGAVARAGDAERSMDPAGADEKTNDLIIKLTMIN